MPPEVMSSTAAPPSPARVHIGEDVEWHTRRKGASEPSRAQHVVDAATGVAAGSAWGAPPDAHHHLWGAASSPTAQRLSASVPPDSDFAGRTTSEFVRDQVNSQADRQVQYVLDGPFDEELQQKLISVRHPLMRIASSDELHLHALSCPRLRAGHGSPDVRSSVKRDAPCR